MNKKILRSGMCRSGVLRFSVPCAAVIAACAVLAGTAISPVSAAPVSTYTIDPIGYNFVDGKRDKDNPLTDPDILSDPGFSSTSFSRGTDESELEKVIDRDDRIEIDNTLEAPYRWVGYLGIVNANGRKAYCTASLISPDAVITAGHCLDGDVASITFSAARNEDEEPYSTVNATQIWFDKNSRSAGKDWGIVKLDTPVGYSAGWFGMRATSTQNLLGQPVHVIGYPSDKTVGTVWQGSGRISKAANNQIFYDTDTAPGQSGAAVLDDVATIYAIHLGGNRQRNFGNVLTPEIFNALINIAYADEEDLGVPRDATGE